MPYRILCCTASRSTSVGRGRRREQHSCGVEGAATLHQGDRAGACVTCVTLSDAIDAPLQGYRADGVAVIVWKSH